MTMNSPQDGFGMLRQLIVDAAPALEIDRAISSIVTFKDTTSVSQLLSLLDDDAAYDEVMFSLIHAAEESDDVTYVRAFINIIPTIARDAPRWSSIVLMRIVNSEDTRRALVRAAREAPLDARSALVMLCEAINARGQEFVAKTLPVMMAAKG